MSDSRRPALPPDPFAGDPTDPAAEMGEMHPAVPLDEVERGEVMEDLRELEEFRRVLAPTGIRGVAVLCEDCEEEHLHDWDILHSSLVQLLEDGTVLPHEPPFEPRPDDYASWEYCRGYVDAVRAMRPWRSRRRG